MPVYEYQCSNCGERTQRLQKYGEDSSGSRCLSCPDGVLSKVYSPFSMPGAHYDPSCDESAGRRFR